MKVVSVTVRVHQRMQLFLGSVGKKVELEVVVQVKGKEPATKF